MRSLKSAGSYRAVLVADQRVGQGADLQQAMPIGVVAGQPAALQAEHDAGSPHADIRHQTLEPLPVSGGCPGVSLVDVDHDDLFGRPAQSHRPLSQVVLTDARLGVVQHLTQGGLADIQIGGPLTDATPSPWWESRRSLLLTPGRPEPWSPARRPDRCRLPRKWRWAAPAAAPRQGCFGLFAARPPSPGPGARPGRDASLADRHPGPELAAARIARDRFGQTGHRSPPLLGRAALARARSIERGWTLTPKRSSITSTRSAARSPGSASSRSWAKATTSADIL